MSSVKSRFLAACLCIAGGMTGVAVSQNLVRPGPRAPYDLDEAVVLVTERYPGRVIRADTIREGQRVVHRIRILTDNSIVRTVYVDPDAGIIERGGE